MSNIDQKLSVVQVAAAVNRLSLKTHFARTPFANRNLSNRTVDALVAKGIDAPERLLFATEAELRQIPGIGPVSLAEIMRYRARFLTVPEKLSAGGAA